MTYIFMAVYPPATRRHDQAYASTARMAKSAVP
jgi:hypothetical protein